jgi:hypothetical protein
MWDIKLLLLLALGALGWRRHDVQKKKKRS